MTNSQIDPTGLTQLVEDIRSCQPDASELLIEHLQSARIAVAGGMEEEGVMSLELAHDLLGTVQDETLRSRSKMLIESLLTQIRGDERETVPA
jgi:hypothetical protein